MHVKGVKNRPVLVSVSPDNKIVKNFVASLSLLWAQNSPFSVFTFIQYPW